MLIDEKHWNTIFDRYKQVESHGRQRPDYSGTGIGLNFTKSLVELHKGKIRMESKVGQGTTFAFILPGDCSIFESKDFADASVADDLQLSALLGFTTDKNGISDQLAIQPDFEKTVLVVEDDPLLNNFLVNSLKDHYKIITAHDGEAGLKMVKRQLPDIIISDVMMPKMDGYELTKNIKENKELCHLPVILLTAKSEPSSQIDGMQSGADLYIVKPFNLNFLMAAIDSQLKNRKRIQKMFFNGMMQNMNNLEINQMDLGFLSKLNGIIEKEFSNPEHFIVDFWRKY